MDLIRDTFEGPWLPYRFSVGDYHGMIATGIVEEGAPFELLDGQVIHKTRSAAGEDPRRVSPQHATTIALLQRLDRQVRKFGCHLSTQRPITIPQFDEPEPDALIVRGTIEDYLEAHPGPDDVLCVIEVADASLGLDRGYKQKLYADSGIRMYVILNLPDRVVELYTQPMQGKGRYGHLVTVWPKQSLTFPTSSGKGLVVPVRRLLP